MPSVIFAISHVRLRILLPGTPLSVISPALESAQCVSSKDCLEKFFLKVWPCHLSQGWILGA